MTGKAKAKSKGLGSKKKQKVADTEEAPAAPSGPQENPINPAVYEKEYVANLNKKFTSSAPYPHCRIEDLCAPDRLRKCRDEIIGNIRATFKETDLFKVFQTGDLANMDALDPETAAKIPELYALRDAVYSKEFREVVKGITGCGELTDRTDMSANVYAQGGHLLCHDDVIGTRCISFIIYLTDPDEAWKPEDGGGLELYPCKDGKRGFPDTRPTACVLPDWNTIAFFPVVPGVSFHSVQEIFQDEKPRLSIQGWYHAATPPEGSEEFATLAHLSAKEAGEERSPFHDIEGGPARTAELSESDREALKAWLNPAYLEGDAMEKIRSQFVEESSIHLTHFVKPELARKLRAAAVAADEADGLGKGRVPKYDAGAGGGWEDVGPPHMQRMMVYGGEEGGESAGGLLAQLRKDVFESGAFARFLRALTGLDVLAQRSQVQRFRPGLDYTVAHMGVLAQCDRLDAVLCFVDDAGEDNHLAWDCGEVGGFECYISAEDDETKGDVAVYKKDEDDGDLLSVQASFNSLSLVHRDTGIMRFVKYVSSRAPSSRWSVTAEYKIQDPDDDEGEEEGGEEEGAKESADPKGKGKARAKKQ